MAISNFRSGELYIFLREVFLIEKYNPGGLNYSPPLLLTELGEVNPMTPVSTS
jgi:hypothetical protein